MSNFRVQISFSILLSFLFLLTNTTDAHAVIQNLNGQTGQSQTFQNDSNVTINSNNDAHTVGWSGYLPISRGGTGLGSFTAGSVLFSNGASFSEDNSNFFWDNVNKRLGLGTATPSATLDVSGTVKATSLTTTNDSTINGLTVGRGGGSNTYNTAIGVDALSSNSTGTESVAVGHGALSGNTGGYYNTAVGYSALSHNPSTGGYNTAVGRKALAFNSTGVRNSAVGSDSLFSNTVGSGNSAVGEEALHYNTIGNDNSAFGFYSLNSNTTGSLNVAIGAAALGYKTTGDGNVAIGWQAGLSGLTNGNGNIFIGTLSQGQNNDDNAIVIGSSAVSAGSRTAVIGNSNMTDAYFGSSSANANVHAKKLYLGNSSIPGCIIMGDVNGGLAYLTVVNGSLTVSTTAPAACQ